MKNVIIIGAGIIGCTIARELSKFECNIKVIEKANDVACGSTKANSGIVHAGFDCKPGTVKAKFNVEGCYLYEKMSEELDFPYIKNGAFVLAFSEDDKATLEDLLDRAINNGCKNVSIITGDEVRAIEPHVSKEVKYALYAKDSGIVSPYEMCIAYAENAASNGVEFIFETKVLKVENNNELYKVYTDKDTYTADVVINCAGLFSDEINNSINEEKRQVVPRKGEYCLLDREYSYITKTTLFQCPTKMGKGILVAPTCHSNILVGPTAKDMLDKDNTDTTYIGLKEAWDTALISVPTLPKGGIITQFSGLRAHTSKDDFTLGFDKKNKGFYNCLGIESPGLASSPAISKFVANEIKEYLNLSLNNSFNPIRKGITHIRNLNKDELKELISKDPLYGHVVCRCEVVSEGEIREAIRRNPGAKDLDGIKRRLRAGMGRCQMGFCTPMVMKILSEELNLPLDKITKKGSDSYLLLGDFENDER